ncbi:MAG: TM0996/MTH895 family glutaredoxin-like protein [Fibrobacterota bacterium]|nr:TM0996/MTH895 family glutaredoxin-like protein [Fibrobacterota bacterium]QQS03424.1 MAG: TM0996/MTH895 family glutaredoxin-like protein [Fibrobacterota bacterium]
MLLEVLGTGCTKCKLLHEAVLKAVTESGVQAEVRKVEDIAKIMEYGVMSTPALVKDGKVLVAGKIPSSKEIASWLSA